MYFQSHEGHGRQDETQVGGDEGHRTALFQVVTWILQQKIDISGKMGKIQIKFVFDLYLILLFHCFSINPHLHSDPSGQSHKASLSITSRDCQWAMRLASRLHMLSPRVSVSPMGFRVLLRCYSPARTPRERGTCSGGGGIFAVCPWPGSILTSLFY